MLTTTSSSSKLGRRFSKSRPRVPSRRCPSPPPRWPLVRSARLGRGHDSLDRLLMAPSSVDLPALPQTSLQLAWPMSNALTENSGTKLVARGVPILSGSKIPAW